eukprot:g29730.t1
MGGGAEVVYDWKVLSFVMNRAQVLYKVVSELPLGLTDVEEATSGAVDAVDHIDGCEGVERPILGAIAADAEELEVGDRILAGKWVSGGQEISETCDLNRGGMFCMFCTS